MADENIHKGHRQRMYKRFRYNGIKSLEDHEKLEMLLFAAYSRRNTNNIAHRLIQKMGSLESVMNAEPNELCEVEDVNKTAAAIIKLVNDMIIRCEGYERVNLVVDTKAKAKDLCMKLCANDTKDEFYVIMLDYMMNFICMPKILRGEEDSFADILKNITQKCLFADCNRIILVNSRPSGFLYPTDEDVDFVKKLAKTYSSLAIELVDCLFVCGKNVTFMSSMNAVPYILWKYILR